MNYKADQLIEGNAYTIILDSSNIAVPFIYKCPTEDKERFCCWVNDKMGDIDFRYNKEGENNFPKIYYPGRTIRDCTQEELDQMDRNIEKYNVKIPYREQYNIF